MNSSPITSNRIQRWADESALSQQDSSRTGDDSFDEKHHEGTKMESKGLDVAPSDMRYEAYMSLLDHRIRNAYVRHPDPKMLLRSY